MSFFKKNGTNVKASILVDVGSGSVGVGISVPKVDGQGFEILWFHREYVVLKTEEISKSALKDVHTAILNAFLELGNAGLRSAGAIHDSVTYDNVLISVCAPWSYTSTKKVHCAKDTEFEVTESFLDSLEALSRENDEENIKKLSEFGLELVSKFVAEVRLNDYVVQKPIGAFATEVTLTLIQTAVSKKILNTLQDASEKILGETQVRVFSFIDILYRNLRQLKPHTSEMCIIDITDEATQMAIIRDDVIVHTSHIHKGIVTLTRSVAKTLSVPLGEAKSIFSLTKKDLEAHYTEKELHEIDSICQTYIEEVSKLLLDTSDALMIPQSIFLHTDIHTEPFFDAALLASSKSAGVEGCVILRVGSGIFNETDGDSALLALAYFNHMKLGVESYRQ